MIIFPAIDIKDGECVRLFKGDYNTVEKVADNYLETATSFKNSGADWIHMVDLDGAKDGRLVNKDIFIDVAKKTGLKVQVGGGIRNLDAIETYLNNGISRVSLGSAAVKSPDLVRLAVDEFGDRIAIGIDAKNGFVATEGWIENSSISYVNLAVKMAEYGVKYFIFTDIEKDGTLSRPNHFKTKYLQQRMNEFGANVIASGGVKTIYNLKTLMKNGVYGAICGKSIYSGSLDLAKAIKTCK